uniref:Uncharacterized protein n=1 Tax=Arundo donax TaxID=35708 RepID=A0A0A8ZAV3_ARUDO
MVITSINIVNRELHNLIHAFCMFYWCNLGYYCNGKQVPLFLHHPWCYCQCMRLLQDFQLHQIFVV